MKTKEYRVKLNVTYTMYIPVKAEDQDSAIDEIEKYINKTDDYEIVNRSPEKSFDIREIAEYKKKRNGVSKRNGISRHKLSVSHR